MSYEIDKAEVLDFFDNHIMKYIIVDLEVLDEIKAKSLGGGGCSIPQASHRYRTNPFVWFYNRSIIKQHSPTV